MKSCPVFSAATAAASILLCGSVFPSPPTPKVEVANIVDTQVLNAVPVDNIEGLNIGTSISGEDAEAESPELSPGWLHAIHVSIAADPDEVCYGRAELQLIDNDTGGRRNWVLTSVISRGDSALAGHDYTTPIAVEFDPEAYTAKVVWSFSSADNGKFCYMTGGMLYEYMDAP